MFLIPRRQVWTQQPQGTVGLSDDVAEYSPVFATVLGSDNRNIVNGRSPSGLVNVKGVGAAGVGLQGDTTASGGRAAYAVQTRGQQLTIVVTVTPGSYVTSYPMLLETDAASESYSEGSFFLLPYYRYSGVQPNYWSLSVNPSEGGNTGYATALIPAPVAGKPHTLVIRMDRALGGFAVIRDVHIDGVKQALSIDDGIPLLEQIPAGSHWNSNNLHINSRGGNSLYGNHLVHAAALFAANPSESVARQWSENPWQIFKRPDSRIFVPVSVGGGSTQTLTPPLHTNSQSFYSPAVSQSSAPQSLTASLFTSSSTIFVPTVQASKALSAGLFSNANTPYSPTVTATKTLATSFYSNAQAFYPPAVSVGAVSISPPLYSNTPTFYAHVLNQVGGPQNVVVPLFNNTQTFYSPLLSPGAVSVAPSLYANAPTFYGLTVTTSKALTASLFSNSSELYEPLVTLAGGPLVIAPSLFSNTASFFTHTVASGLVQLYPVRFDSPSVFYAPVVSTGSFSGSISDEDITRIVQAVLLQLNNESIAAAVWNAQTASHVAVGTFGKFIKSLLTTFKFLGLK